MPNDEEKIKWRKWTKVEPMPEEVRAETCLIIAACLPKIIERHDQENETNA